jgi:uncharacterized protein
VQPEERIEALDVVRGFALLGVLFVNGMNWFRTNTQYERSHPELVTSLADRIVQRAETVLMDGKFISLFSFLFGLGVAVQADRAEARHGKARRFLARRMLVLLGLGAAHVLLLWMGDILHVYALLGFLLLLFLGRKTRTLLIWIAILNALPILFAPGYSLFQFMHEKPPIPARDADPAEAAKLEALMHAYAHGSFLEVARQRLIDFAGISVQVLPQLPDLSSLFLMGIVVHRQGIFRDPAAHRRTLWRTVAAGLFVAIPLQLVIFGLIERGSMRPSAYIGVALAGLAPLSKTVLALAYGAGLLLLLQRPRARAWLSPIGKAGRMALTNYLMQSVLCSFVFYGLGLGLYGKLGPAAAAPIFVAIYTVEVLWSGPWLSRFRYGPVEWVWRSLTYGKAQPLRVPQEATARPAAA